MFLCPIYIPLALHYLTRASNGKWALNVLRVWDTWRFNLRKSTCLCFLSSHHIYLGTWVCRYFVPILTKYHFIREAKFNGFCNEHPNETFVSTWRKPTLRRLECWTQVICGSIGIIEETRIWEMPGNDIFSPSSLLWQSTYYRLCSFNIIVFVLVKFLQILYNGQCAQTFVWRQ